MNKFTKNPIGNAVLALVYIVIVVSVMSFLNRTSGGHDTFITPILALSLFTLSAAVMGYLFLGQPIQMYLDGKKKPAVTFFMKTVGTFAVITIIVLLVSLSGRL